MATAQAVAEDAKVYRHFNFVLRPDFPKDNRIAHIEAEDLDQWLRYAPPGWLFGLDELFHRTQSALILLYKRKALSSLQTSATNCHAVPDPLSALNRTSTDSKQNVRRCCTRFCYSACHQISWPRHRRRKCSSAVSLGSSKHQV
eukprot:gnl/MRDRNA2_/MRDRNA2_325733_c0_seq1.p1 gnl/MRDRNA2_/MRDRNA2_325733_c0~~gnl/MRDRNA2_/MRDRNA2_325733_c0_seq1.p1  ORF type:complete len:168 (+),score=13.47 gnl/MRDRNA2_/MRDRNA2_325733_c0_seq1:74-505(+)